MGSFISTIGNYSISYKDYQWDYIEQYKPMSYYTSKVFDAIFSVKQDGKYTDQQIKIPFLKLVNIEKKEKKSYEYEHKKNALWDYLFFLIQEKDLKIKNNIGIVSYNGNRSSVIYYLNSPLLDDNILLTNTPIEYLIEEKKQLEWLNKKCLELL